MSDSLHFNDTNLSNKSMNRIIKFRVWDKESEKMYPVDGIQFATQDIIAYDEDLAEDQILPFDSPLMQFTGLTDSKGKEIYEGDLLKIYMGGDLQDGYYEVKNMLNFYLDCNRDEMYNRITNKTIIGNIYENADLLKDIVSGEY